MAGQVLDGMVAVVTGGASGIGRAISIQFAAEGAAVVIADLDAERAHSVADEVNGMGGTARSYQVDVTDELEISRAIGIAEQEFGKLNILSCNAGLAGYPRSAVDADPDEFDRIFAVNVKGVWYSVRSAVPALRRAGGGSIIVMGSIMGERSRPGFGAYASSKAAVNHLARTLALELADDAIRVNAIAPVATETAMLPQFLGPDDPKGARERFIASIPLGRLAQPEDVGGAAVFLASQSAAFITGAVIPVDGGRSV